MSDSGKYTCILSVDDTEDAIEEDINLTVFERLQNKVGRDSFLNNAGSQSDVDFELKYLEYKMNNTSECSSSYSVICSILSIVLLQILNMNNI